MQVDYDAAGSSSGVKRVVARDVAFGASDRPLTRHELDGNSLAQFPTAVGGVVIGIRVPGVRADQMHLDGKILANIYLGHIQSRNDPEIAAMNPTLHLPALPIVPVVHASGSGTSFAVTQYLSKVLPEFNSRVGVTSDLIAPKTKTASTNQDMFTTLQAVEGAIGYFDYSYAISKNVPTVSLKNHWVRSCSPRLRACRTRCALPTGRS